MKSHFSALGKAEKWLFVVFFLDIPTVERYNRFGIVYAFISMRFIYNYRGLRFAPHLFY